MVMHNLTSTDRMFCSGYTYATDIFIEVLRSYRTKPWSATMYPLSLVSDQTIISTYNILQLSCPNSNPKVSYPLGRLLAVGAHMIVSQNIHVRL